MITNVIFTSIPQLLSNCSTLLDRINALDGILTSMETALATAATTGQFEEYKLDTGQTKTEIRYRDQKSLQASYEGLFDLQQKMINRYNAQKTGRQFRLMDSRNFIGRRFNNGY